MPWSTKQETYSFQSYHSYGGYEETRYTYTTLHTLNNEKSKLHGMEIETDIDHRNFDIQIRFANKEDAEAFAASLSKNIQFYKDGPFVAMHYKSELHQKGLFLKALIKLDPCLNEIAEQLFQEIGLEKLKPLRAMPVNEAIDFVIANQATNYGRAEWLLLDYLDDKTIPADTLLKLINGISQENPCFKNTSDIGLKLMAIKAPNPLIEHKSEQCLSLDAETVNEEKRIENLELELSYALNGSVKGLADPIFSQLCNDSWDTPMLEGVSGNHTFLVNMARRIREERAARLVQNPISSTGVTSSVSSSSGVTSSASSSSGVTSAVSSSSGVTSAVSSSSGVTSAVSSSSGVTSAVSSSSGVTSAVSSSSSQPLSTPVTIRLPGAKVSRLINLFSRTAKPTADTNGKSMVP